MGYLGRRQVRVCIDVIALFWIAVAFFEFVLLMGYVDDNLTIAVKGLIGFALLVGGLALSASPSMGVGIVLDTWISLEETIDWFTNVFLSFVIILLMNSVVRKFTPFLSSVYITTEIFVMLIGISEESSLRGYLLNLLDNVTGDGGTAIGIIISSAIGSTLHAGIYGARNLTVIATVFVCFLALGYIYASSTRMIKGPFQAEAVPARRISAIMTGHALVNLMAILRGSMI